MIDIDPRWDRTKHIDEAAILAELTALADLSTDARNAIVARATELVKTIRAEGKPTLMDVFLAEYGLSTDEGIALMTLAEALLRVPDAVTVDALIEDKVTPSDWASHIGHSSSNIVNASTLGLMLTDRVLEAETGGFAGTIRGAIKRLGEPVIRAAVGRIMREMGRQFVLGQDIQSAMKRARKLEAKGYTYSYDMLGEAAMTARDAARYAKDYSDAIDAISANCGKGDVGANPGISVKLSALHPRYEVAKTDRVMAELVPVLRDLCRKAATAGMGLNIDAEEADRLGLSMKVIEAVMGDEETRGWDGLGIVVQGYGRRASVVIRGLYEMAERHGRRIMIRLVKGAYWDTEVKHAQVEGLEGFPVFTRKAASDVSYIANARMLLSMTDRVYPQFATHNAHTIAAVLEMAEGLAPSQYEFQRLHGMGESAHEVVHAAEGTRCRIYAPVGAHRDLLAYLVRRLLENGANSSFVNQIADPKVPAQEVARCPFDVLAAPRGNDEPKVKEGPELFAPDRRNSKGFDLFDVTELARIDAVRTRPEPLSVAPIIAGEVEGEAALPMTNPATGETIGEVTRASARDVETALTAARPWSAPVAERARILNRAADLYEENFGRFFSLLATEAGKSLPDAVAELREAVDFLRYYAARAEEQPGEARGIFTCISPWNFPLAIFTGQIAAALATGNGVLSKPAETTVAIAAKAVELMHEAGVPREALQLLPGAGRVVGAVLTSDARISGVAFTGSTATAKTIQSAMAGGMAPGAPLIAETGGLNAMIVDSTALPEQAIRDIVASAFQSAGQRCSALRCLYVQEDIEPTIREMLIGAMNELALGDPWSLSTDVGPVITADARDEITDYVDVAAADGRLVHRMAIPEGGHFVAPSLIRVGGIEDLEREIFGPVLHIATFKATQLDKVVDAINASGYGLTFGLHTRINSRVEHVAARIHVGNMYVNRNQIGAIVGSQPFGGEGLSGTGPKAGGPNYLARFQAHAAPMAAGEAAPAIAESEVARRIEKAQAPAAPVGQLVLPGPTGELNRLSYHTRPPVLCLGPGAEAAAAQARAVEALDGIAVELPEALEAEALTRLPAFGAAIWWGDEATARAYADALSRRDGPIVGLVTGAPDSGHTVLERHLCVDTTAAGGNASLLSGRDD